MKRKIIKRKPIKPYKLTDNKLKILLSLLYDLREEYLSRPYTLYVENVIGCCSFLVETLAQMITPRGIKK